MTQKSRAFLHQRLRTMIVQRLQTDLQLSIPRQSAPALPVALLAPFVASTFIVVLDWWLDTHSGLTPAEVDAVFRSLVAGALRGTPDKT
jgi:hypothetical protein